jgi:flavodoxin/Pyruvate/2-oxoacid:ferredoxin oxidoreductase delta subunit
MKKAKVLLAYFSQSGTTRKIAEQIAQGFRIAEWETVYYNINNGPMTNIDEYDIIGIGTPTYYFRPPFHVSDFINKLPDLNGKSSFVFILHGTKQGDSGNIIRKRLKKLYAQDLGYFHCGGTDYYLGYVKKGYLFSPNLPGEYELSSAREFGKTLSRRYDSGIIQLENYDRPAAPMYKIERALTNRIFTKYFYSKLFHADKNCTNCNICVKNCPTENISIVNKRKPVWHSNCLLCGYCAMNCPEEAVHSPFDWAIFAPFMNYNIRTASRASIPHVKVVHTKGETIIIK